MGRLRGCGAGHGWGMGSAGVPDADLHSGEQAAEHVVSTEDLLERSGSKARVSEPGLKRIEDRK